MDHFCCPPQPRPPDPRHEYFYTNTLVPDLALPVILPTLPRTVGTNMRRRYIAAYVNSSFKSSY